MPVEELDHKFKGLQLERPRQSPVDLLESVREHRPERPWLSICAPMVRYSKLPFRDLIRSYDVDVCFSQMIVADVFKHSEISRAIDWLTNSQDDPIIVQVFKTLSNRNSLGLQTPKTLLIAHSS